MLNLASSSSCVDVHQMWEIPEGQIRGGGKEVHTLCIYRKRETDKQTSFTTEESAPAITNRGRSTERVIYLSLNVNLNIHLATLFCPALCLLLICFFLCSPLWRTQNHLYVDIRKGLTWLLLLLQPVCLCQLLTWGRDRRKDKREII